jgi:hypothetical protein
VSEFLLIVALSQVGRLTKHGLPVPGAYFKNHESQQPAMPIKTLKKVNVSL